LLATSSLIWHDTDKKGRPRQRDCRPDLLELAVVPAADATQPVALRALVAIDPMGRSIRPQQIQHWLAQQLDVPLTLGAVRREALLLRAC